MKKGLISLLAILMAVCLLASCGPTPETPATESPANADASPAAPESGEPAPESAAPADTSPAASGETLTADQIKVGFVYIGVPGDEGFTYAHDQGRKMLEQELGVQTMVAENVPDNADCAKAIRNLIDQGCNVIFSTSFGFMEFTHDVAKEYPNVKFLHCSGYITDTNMSAYFGRMYQARYLSGIVAGMKTESNKIGYVAAMPIPEVVRGADAFALGVKSVNPNATIEVVWTNTWYDPAIEKSAANELLNKGCDIIAQHQDTTAPQLAAQEKGKWAIGYNSSTADAAPKAYLTAPIWHWGIYYVDQVKKIMDGTWTSSNYWGSINDGIVSLDKLSDLCAPGTQEAVDAALTKIESGELYIFEGPLKDNTGAERLAAGAKLTDEEMLKLDWFVDNIIGTVPH